MILDNFKKLLIAEQNGVTLANSNITLISGESCLTAAAPLLRNGTISNYNGSTTTTTNPSGTVVGYYSLIYSSLVFGSGTTEPTADDYTMESPYNTTDHFSWQTQEQSAFMDACTKTITATIGNISDEDLTVSEIGVVLYGISSSTIYNTTLIARSLITPVTIAPNETKTFQYTMAF